MQQQQHNKRNNRKRNAIEDDDTKQWQYGEPPSKMQKLMPTNHDNMNDVEHKFENIYMSSHDFDKDQEEKFAFGRNVENVEIFCKNKRKDEILKNGKFAFNDSLYDVIIYEPTGYLFRDEVRCYGRGTIKIKETLKKCGFTWNKFDNMWCMNKHYFMSDYEIWIGSLIKTECTENHLKLKVFDFNQKIKERYAMIKAMDTLITFNLSSDEITIRTTVDEEYMMKLLAKHKYRLIDNYSSTKFNIYNKTGTLYHGHIETWKEYAVMFDLVIGYDAKNVSKPKCEHCGNSLNIHKVKRGNKHIHRRFYNCDYCWRAFDRRKESFLWADGELTDHPKDVEKFLNQNLTQPFSQLHV